MPLMTQETLLKMMEDDPTLFTDMLTKTPPPSRFWDVCLPVLPERRPHLVYYRQEKARYVPPDHFLMCFERDRPSDCCWIVPGTGQ